MPTEEKYKKIIDLAFIFIIVGFYIFLFGGINIIHSGYHIVDDHEIYYYPSIINKNTIWEQLSIFLQYDGRFRPLYWLHRTFLFYIFKQNFILYYFEYFIMGILSSILLFFTFKNISKNGAIAFLLLTLVFLGNSLTIFEGLGYGELFSLTLLSVSLFFMTIKEKKKYKICQILSLTFLILSMFSKELFLLAYPFVIIFKVFYDNESNITKAIKSNILYIFVSLFFFIIIFTLNINFMGKDNSAPYFMEIQNVFHYFKEIFELNNIKAYFFENILFILISLLGLMFTKDIKIEKIKLISFLFIGYAFVVSHILFLSLNPNNFFQYRYLFPSLLGPVFFLAYVLKYYKLKNKIVYCFLLLAIFGALTVNYKNYPLSLIKKNVDMNIKFNNDIKESMQKINKADNILLIGSAVETMEFFESICRCYNYYGYNNIYVFPCIKKDYSELNSFEKNLYDFFSNRFPNKFLNNMDKPAKLILVFEYDNDVKKENMKKSKIDFNNYTKINQNDARMDFYLFNK